MNDEENEGSGQEALENKAKRLLNKGKSVLVKGIKQLFSLILKKVGKYVLIAVAIIIGFVLLFNELEKVEFSRVIDVVGGVISGETEKIGLSPNGTTQNIDFASSQFVSIATYNGEYCIKIDKGLIEQIEKQLEKNNIKPKDLRLKDFECFKQFIISELVTQYPKLGNLSGQVEDSDGNIYVDGVIEMKRAMVDPEAPELKMEVKKLKYTTPSDFKGLCDSNEKQALEYFTLNENRELVIAYYTDTKMKVEVEGDTSIDTVPEEAPSYIISEQAVDYLSIVKKYTMPFGLQLAILQTSDSVDMALDFSKLAQNSKMEITIEDELEIDTYIDEVDVEQHIEGEKKVTYRLITECEPVVEEDSEDGEEEAESKNDGNKETTSKNNGKKETTSKNNNKKETTSKNNNKKETTSKNNDKKATTSKNNGNKETTSKNDGNKETGGGPPSKEAHKHEHPSTGIISPVDEDKKELHYKTKTVVTTDIPRFELTKVDCWLAKFEKTYNFEKTTEPAERQIIRPEIPDEPITPSTSDKDVQEFINGLSEPSYHTSGEYNSSTTKYIDAVEGIDLRKIKKKKIKSTTQKETIKFISSQTIVESNEEKVFEIFKNNRRAYGSLKDAKKWFYGLLQRNDATLVDFVDVMKYFIEKFENSEYDGEFDFNLLEPGEFETATSGSSGTGGVFGCNLTREEFINKAKAYKQGDSTYQNYMAKYAGDFYDACKKYNVNPCLAYAHACLETGYGSSAECQSIKNYFGMAHGNTSASGKSYASVKDSVEDYCKWITENTTSGKDAYNQSVQVSKKYAKENKAFSGDPATNMYDLYSRYAFLGSTHVTANDDYTVEWGKGGRTYTRIIYGGYNYSSKSWKSKSEYDKECGNKHPGANDKTTTKEQADYAEHAMNSRISILTDIFGKDAMATGGSILSVAKDIHTYMEQNKYAYCLLGRESDPSHRGFGGAHGLNVTFEASKNGHHLSCCATYVSWVLIDAGYTKVQGVPMQHSGSGLGVELQRLYKCKKITQKSDLKPGDICFWCTGSSHTQIYGENGVWYNAGGNDAIKNKPHAYVYNTWDYALRLLE